MQTASFADTVSTKTNPGSFSTHSSTLVNTHSSQSSSARSLHLPSGSQHPRHSYNPDTIHGPLDQSGSHERHSLGIFPSHDDADETSSSSKFFCQTSEQLLC